VVVTSREAGFRVVGSAMADVCDHYRIADFGEEDIRRLTVAWYREVVSTEAALAEAEALANTIIANGRVLQLARNPLLLTTLLLVKRWIGELPRRRSVLYDEAIKVLLRTWNVEGHKPIELDEATPQLAFVAYAMLDAGTQRISLADLTKLLTQARQQMPELLAYARMSVDDFVSRIELRSSLLSMSGYEIEDGRLVPVYEFRHLTFQEYLTALAIVEGYYPNRGERDTVTSLLKSRFSKAAWKEVIPLAAVLAGPRAAPLVQALIQAVKENQGKSRKATLLGEPDKNLAATLLAECLVDEVKLAPPLAEAAIKLVAGCTQYDEEAQVRYVSQFLTGKYGTSFRQTVEREFAEAMNLTDEVSLNVALIGLYDLFGPIDDNFNVVKKSGPDGIKAVCERLSGEIIASDKFRQAQIILIIAIIAAELDDDDEIDWLPKIFPALANFLGHIKMLLRSSWEPHHYAACFTVDVMSEIKRFLNPEMTSSMLGSLFELWRYAKNPQVKWEAASTFEDLPIIDRTRRPLGTLRRELEDFLRNQYEQTTDSAASFRTQPLIIIQRAALIAAYYLGGPWSDGEIAELIGEHRDLTDQERDLLRGLGNAGQKVLYKQKEPRSQWSWPRTL